MWNVCSFGFVISRALTASKVMQCLYRLASEHCELWQSRQSRFTTPMTKGLHFHRVRCCLPQASLHAHMRLGLVALKSQLDAQRPPWQAQQAVV